MDNWHVGGAVRQNRRRRDIARHVFENSQRTARQFGRGKRRTSTVVEEHSHDADAGVIDGFDARDVIDLLCHLALKQCGDSITHLRRTHAGVVPDNGNHRYVDFGENIHRHARKGAHGQ